MAIYDEQRRAARALAGRQHGVISRRQLASLGLNRDVVAHEREKGRWQVRGRAVVADVSPLDEHAHWRVALANSGPRTVLDGVTALRAAGLTGFTDSVHLSMPMGGRATQQRDVIVHVLRGFSQEDVLDAHGLRRIRPAMAAARAGIWAASDRAGVTLLAMAVQQRLVSPEALKSTVMTLPRNRRKLVLLNAVGDLATGAESMPEIDFARLCREYGLPEPTRQVIRRRPNGTAYLDAAWEQFGLVVEVDGIHHANAAYVVPDALRHNDIALDGSLILHVPALGLRASPKEFMAQVRQGLIRQGWVP